MDAFQLRALDIVSSGKVREAFDVAREPAAVRARYGEQGFRVIRQDDTKNYHIQGHPGIPFLQARLLARVIRGDIPDYVPFLVR
jgi:hypothetical protein